MEIQQVCRRVLQVIFVLSLPFFTLMVLHSAVGETGYVISLMFTLLIAAVISRKVTDCVITRTNKIYLLAAFAAALYIVYMYAWQGNGVTIMQSRQGLLDAVFPVQMTSNRLVVVLIIMAFPSVCMLIYWILDMVWPYIVQFARSLDSFEKRYLCIVFFIAAAGITFFYQNTAVCYYAQENGFVQAYDVLYTTDSAEIYGRDSFLRILSGPNDIRQPLFGLFALPAALLGRAVAAVFFFVPDMYAVALGVLQFMLEAVTVIMLLRMLKVEDKERIWLTMFFGASYAYLIHGLMVEQYVTAYFYVILVLYVYQNSQKLNFTYFGAVSTLLTSGILFGFISKAKNGKQWIKDMFKCLVIYMGMVTVCGQLPQFLGMKKTIAGLMMFSGEEITWGQKWVQFTHFFRDMLFAPAAKEGYVSFHNYRSIEYTQVSWIGILMLACVIAGFLLTYKEWLSKVAMFWVCFSALILFVIGWGTAENGLLLYALYFAWAYIVLLYQLLKKAVKNSVLRNVILAALTAAMLVRNIYEVIQIYQFGVTYYPI